MKSSKDKYENTKEKIISSAMELFMEKGYAKTTLEDITQNVGLTRGAFYWNFQKKTDLLKEIEHRYEHTVKDLFQFEEAESAYLSLKNMIVKNLEQRLSKRNDFLYFIRYKIEAGTELTDLVDRQKAMDSEIILDISDLLQRGIREGEFVDTLDVKKCAFYLYTTLIGVGTYATTHFQQNAEYTDYIPADYEAFAEFLLRGIRK